MFNTQDQLPEKSEKTWQFFACAHRKASLQKKGTSSSFFQAVPGDLSAHDDVPAMIESHQVTERESAESKENKGGKVGWRRPVPSAHKSVRAMSRGDSLPTAFPRVFHGVNLVPPTHGLHADQVMRKKMSTCIPPPFLFVFVFLRFHCHHSCIQIEVCVSLSRMCVSKDVTLRSMRRAVAVAASQRTADVSVVAVELVGDLDYPLPDLRPSLFRQPENQTRCLGGANLPLAPSLHPANMSVELPADLHK
jgi:hypothetical protein